MFRDGSRSWNPISAPDWHWRNAQRGWKQFFGKVGSQPFLLNRATHQEVNDAPCDRQALAGKDRAAQTRLTDGIVKALVETRNASANSVSVAIEEIKPEDRMDTVYRPDTEKNMAELYKKPGYDPF
ncbi:hypothetical protein [Paraburkholderia sp. JHI869]|uniref:hypothetical protein n=1 Tax=Paraburkholderia sp. JHI869 TaxID=3112959 RepID=UPI00317458A8